MDIDFGGEVEVVARRLDFLDALADGPLHKPDLVERLGHSRSTVDRAIDELTEAGLVERLTPGYVTTQVGQLAAKRYREFLADEQTVFAAADALASVPHDAGVPPALLADGDVVTTDPGYRLFELVAHLAGDADRLRLMFPSLSDSRYVRLCHDAVVREELDVTLVVPATALADTREEFPHLADELSDAEGFTAYSEQVPDYGLVVTSVETDGEHRQEMALVSAADGEVTGYVHSAAPAAVEWAESVMQEAIESGRDATTDLSGGQAPVTMPSMAGDRLPATLRDEGFVRVDDDYFRRREPLDPATAWRSGLGLPEVDAGYAVPRHREEGGEPLAAELIERLRAGTDVALVGPAGAGKSTVCKRVACQWADADDVVVYRESGTSRAFESVGALADALDRTDGPALVVVEDAVRAEATAVFDAMRRVAGREDVAVLVDARESEWRDPEGVVDARLEAFRQEHVETVTMPTLSAADCERLIERVRSVTGAALDIPVDQLVEEIRADAAGSEVAPQHGVLLLFHRLARCVDPLAGYEGETPTTLDEDVERVRADLAEIGETATDVGVLVALLTAAGAGVTPAHAHALVTDGSDRAGVERALDCLLGEVLFETDDDDRPYRTGHEAWAVRYLERFLDAAGERAARQRVGRVISQVLSLADDAYRREQVVRAVGDGDPVVDEVVADPTGWADDSARTLLSVGSDYPKLAGLFGTSSASTVVLPEACSATARATCIKLRAESQVGAGELSAARDEYELLAEWAPETDDPERFELESLLGRAECARRQGDPDTAEALIGDALVVAASVETSRATARCHLEQGRIGLHRGDHQAAEESLVEAREAAADVPGRGFLAAVEEELGDVANERREFEAAERHYTASLEGYRAVGDRRGEAGVVGSLGSIAKKRGDAETCRDRLLQSLEIAQEVGDRALQIKQLHRLGTHASIVERNVEQAEEYFEQGIELARESEERSTLLRLLHGLATVKMKRGEVSAAREEFQHALEITRDADMVLGEARFLRSLALLHYDHRGDLAATRRHSEKAVELAETGDDSSLKLEAKGVRALPAVKSGKLDVAADYLDDALALAREMDYPQKEGEVRGSRVELHRKRGAFEAARAEARAAREIFEELGWEDMLAMTLRSWGQVELAAGDPEAALQRFENAVDHEQSDELTVALSRAMRRCGDAERAADRVREVTEADSEFTLPVDVQARIEQGAAARDCGELDTAATHLEAALSVAREQGFRCAAVRARYEQALLQAERGDDAAARDQLVAATKAATEMGWVPMATRGVRALARVAEESTVEEWGDRVADLDGVEPADLRPAEAEGTTAPLREDD